MASSTRGIFRAIAFSLPGMFAILAVGLAGIVIALGTALTAAPLLWVVTAVFLFFVTLMR